MKADVRQWNAPFWRQSAAGSRGLPLVEAADHGAIRALHDILDPENPSPVKGILRPEVADPAFGLAVRLIRKFEQRQRKGIGTERPANFFEMPVSERWAALSGAGAYRGT